MINLSYIWVRICKILNISSAFYFISFTSRFTSTTENTPYEIFTTNQVNEHLFKYLLSRHSRNNWHIVSVPKTRLKLFSPGLSGHKSILHIISFLSQAVETLVLLKINGTCIFIRVRSIWRKENVNSFFKRSNIRKAYPFFNCLFSRKETRRQKLYKELPFLFRAFVPLVENKQDF